MTPESKSVVLEIDHASICGSNLDTLRQAFTDVGLTPDFGGPHGNGITQMAIIGFDDASYLELIAPVKPGALRAPTGRSSCPRMRSPAPGRWARTFCCRKSIG